MSELATLQNAFQDYLLEPSQNAIRLSIVSTARMHADKRLGVYAYAYYARLIEVLSLSYPALYAYLGHDNFYSVGREYAQAHPSTFRSIRWFGDQLANFLQQHPVYKDYPYLVELATIEWTIEAVFDAIDQSTLTIAELALVPPEAWAQMQIQLHANVRRLDLAWNCIKIWQAMKEEQDPPAPEENIHKVHWVFWRKDFTHQYCSLEQEDAWALDAALKGENFGTICEGLLQWQTEDQVALRAASLLKGWILAGLVSKTTY